MSHTATVNTEFKRLDVLKTICLSKGYGFSDTEQTAKFYDKSKKTGHLITIPGWEYPIVITKGRAYLDTFNGRWGKDAEFDQLRQSYALAVSAGRMAASGVQLADQFTLPDGSIELVYEQ